MKRLTLTSPLILALAVSALFFILPAIHSIRFPQFAESQFFESDTYYYLDVARNSQHVRFFSFDGQRPTNGFHPLWQWLEYMGVKTGALPISDNWKTLRHLYFLDLAFLTAAVGILAWFSARRMQHAWLVIWIFCPGLLWFIFSHSQFFSVWTDLNGMETAVELFFFSSALVAFERFQDTGKPVALLMGNLLAGCMVLARLDDIFFLLPLTFLTLSAGQHKVWARMIAASPPYLMLSAYLFYNYRTVGLFMPISGAHKAHFVLKAQAIVLVRHLLPVHAWRHRFPESMNYEIYFHVLQMVVPAVVSGLYLGWRWRSRSFRCDLLVCLAVGIVLKSTYNFAFVDIMEQGHWYYGPSIVISNLFLVMVLDRLIAREGVAAIFPERGELYSFALSVMASVFFFGFLVRAAPDPNDFAFYRIQSSGPALRTMIQSFGDQRFVEFDDGEIGFASRIPSVSGFGLTGDLESVRALENGTFLPLMERRGITLIAAGAQYHQGVGDMGLKEAPDGMWGGLKPSELKRYYWRYLGGTKDVYFYRLTRVSG